jgi:hypothetical protein
MCNKHTKCLFSNYAIVQLAFISFRATEKETEREEDTETERERERERV